MSDMDGTGAAEGANEETTTEETTSEETVDYKAEAEKWKALSRKHEGNAKQNAAAAKRLAEIEDANKSEVEKATSAATEAMKRAEAAEARAARLEIAAEKGLTPAQAKRLVGSTREELEADADELMATFTPDTGSNTGKPKEKLRSGAAADDGAGEEKSVKEVLAEIPRAR